MAYAGGGVNAVEVGVDGAENGDAVFVALVARVAIGLRGADEMERDGLETGLVTNVVFKGCALMVDDLARPVRQIPIPSPTATVATIIANATIMRIQNFIDLEEARSADCSPDSSILPLTSGKELLWSNCGAMPGRICTHHQNRFPLNCLFFLPQAQDSWHQAQMLSHHCLFLELW